MIVDFSQINYEEPLLLILKTATENVLGVLGYAKNRGLDLNYNPVSTLSFELPANVDGIDVPFYDDVVGMRIIEVPNIGQFIINNPQESGDGVHREKSVEAYSLEYEFARKNITLPEGTYRFHDTTIDNSVLDIIMELMPAWSIGTVPSSIANKYRTFSVENENVYDFMMNTLQETYGCVFEFNTLTRTVNVRDISTEPSQRAVWLSRQNLAKELEITEDTENIYTRLDVNGADGVNIRDVNPDGTNKIVNLDYFMTPENMGGSQGQSSANKTLNVIRPFTAQAVSATVAQPSYTYTQKVCVSGKNLWTAASTMNMPSSVQPMPGAPRPDMKFETDARLPSGKYILSYHYTGKQPVSCSNQKAVVSMIGARVYEVDTNMPTFSGQAGDDIDEDIEEIISLNSPLITYTRTYTFSNNSDTATISNIMLRPQSISDATYEAPDYDVYTVSDGSVSLPLPEGLSVVYCGTGTVTFNYSADNGMVVYDKYYAWKELYNNNKESYYNLTIRYSLKLMQKVTEQANLTELKNEVVNLDNQRAVIIQSLAQALSGVTQQDLDDINDDIAAAEAAVAAKQAEIDAIDTSLASVMSSITTIKNRCNFRNYFTDAEWLLVDRYIKDGDVTESTFVAESVGAYMDEGRGNSVTSVAVAIDDSLIDTTTDSAGRQIINAHGGTLTIGTTVEAAVVQCTITKEYNSASTTLTAYLNDGEYDSSEFTSGCITLTGTTGAITVTPGTGDESDLGCTFTGYMYFTYDVSEYKRRSVAWDLFEYGEATLASLAFPSYSFTVNSANFIALPEYIAFRNALRLGERIYLEKGESEIVRPILVGATLNLDSPSELDLKFGDKYTINNPAQKLVELLGQTVSMGKSVDAGKFTYSAFRDSGAATGIKTKMMSALDASKNNIINSSGQAISMDGSGLHLRKYTSAAQTAYEDEQIWMNNNMIAMTDDGWDTAKLAIGKFHDSNAGDCWGIVAPAIMGTLLAGESLIIESEKKDGGTAVFKMDGDGCRLYNSDFTVSRVVEVGGVNKTTTISINPDFGIAIGDGSLYSIDAQTGKKVLDTTHANFYADDSGNLYLTGAIRASSLYINDNGSYSDIDTYGNAHFTVTDQQIIAAVGNNFLYLKQNGIEMSSSNSIVIKNSSSNSVVTLDSTGIALASNGSISMSGGSISMISGTSYVGIDPASGVIIRSGLTNPAASIQTGTNVSSVDISSTGVSISSGQSTNVTVGQSGISMASGTFSVVADDGTNSFIRFGGTAADPNFSLGLGGDIKARNGTFATLSVQNGDIVTAPPGFSPPRIVVSQTAPSASNTVWFKPIANSMVDFTYSGSGNSFGTGTNGNVTVTFTKVGSASLATVSNMMYGIQIGIYSYGGTSYTNNYAKVEIKDPNGSVWYEIYNASVGSLDSGGSNININTLLSPYTVSNLNLSTLNQISVKVTFTRHVSTSARLVNNTTFTLRCSNDSSTGAAACDVFYIT